MIDGKRAALCMGRIPGEGAAAVSIRPLARELEYKGPIHEVVKGTLIRHVGGSQRRGAPDPETRADTPSEALTRARVPTCSIRHIESAAYIAETFERWNSPREPSVGSPLRDESSSTTSAVVFSAAAGSQPGR